VPPIVVEGVLCASTRFDARQQECRPLPPPLSPEEGDGEEVEGECPLCVYLKASPCRDIFLPFKECLDGASDTNEQEDIKRCEPHALKLHECILEHGLFKEAAEEEGDGKGDEKQE